MCVHAEEGPLGSQNLTIDDHDRHNHFEQTDFIIQCMGGERESLLEIGNNVKKVEWPSRDIAKSCQGLCFDRTFY